MLVKCVFMECCIIIWGHGSSFPISWVQSRAIAGGISVKEFKLLLSAVSRSSKSRISTRLNPVKLPVNRGSLNTAVCANTTLDPRQMMEVCLSIERQNERVRIHEKSARTLDIDIIFYGDQIVHEPGLTIPHPRFRERKFVLVPLAEIGRDEIDPVTGRAVEALLAACLDTSKLSGYNRSLKRLSSIFARPLRFEWR